MHLALNYKKKAYIGIVLIPEKNELWISNGERFGVKREMGQLLNLIYLTVKVFKI